MCQLAWQSLTCAIFKTLTAVQWPGRQSQFCSIETVGSVFCSSPVFLLWSALKWKEKALYLISCLLFWCAWEWGWPSVCFSFISQFNLVRLEFLWKSFGRFHGKYFVLFIPPDSHFFFHRRNHPLSPCKLPVLYLVGFSSERSSGTVRL